jgi:hypothetical protein
MAKKLRLLKVTVQPVFVLDDDKTSQLIEVPIQPTTVAAADWWEYPKTTFKKAMGELEQSLNDNSNTPAT